MRALGWVGLVLALAIVGLLVKKQLGGVVATSAGPVGQATDPRAQSQQIQQQFKQSLDAAVQQPRPMPDDK
jgi:hypothetical protein